MAIAGDLQVAAHLIDIQLEEQGACMRRLTNTPESLRWRPYPVHVRAIPYHAARILNRGGVNAFSRVNGWQYLDRSARTLELAVCGTT